MRTLEQRLAKVDTVLTRLGLPSSQNRGEGVTPDRGPNGLRSKLSDVLITDQRLPSADYSIPFLSGQGQKWIQLAGEEAAQSSPLGGPSGYGQIDPSTFTTLPDKGVVQQCFQRYKFSRWVEMFPVFRDDSFSATIDKAYGRPACTASQACVLAMCTVSPLFYWHTQEQPPAIQSTDIAIVHLLMPHILVGRPSLELVQTLVLMTVRIFALGSFEGIDMYLCLAARALFALGAHLKPPSGSAEEEKHIYRDLFWIVHIIDVDHAIRSGRPTVMSNAWCDLTLPQGRWPSYENGRVRYGMDLHLNLIKSEAYTRLYSLESLGKSDAELLKDIRLLDKALEDWRTSLPSDIRPALTYREDCSVAGPLEEELVFLCLEYHRCVSSIHQAVTRVTRSVGHEDAISSSLDIAIDASRSTLLYFRDQHKYLTRALFWLWSSYPITALLMLFTEAMSNTGSSGCADDSQCSRDLAVAQDAVDALREVGNAATGHSPRLQKLTRFLEEILSIARVLGAEAYAAAAKREYEMLGQEPML
ncbi:uncharacterized protein RHO25_011003 [Cercospora beticola]|uniref:Xylanolytic transcriptional activator regulatory domain-containing protein n=1 Tax=Cercospora beticola TaxID=122368 RepID=A0ABZ0P3R9_CERBT|nr:hypothetical protein RHO25_011003 [Cercospora beticola]